MICCFQTEGPLVEPVERGIVWLLGTVWNCIVYLLVWKSSMIKQCHKKKTGLTKKLNKTSLLVVVHHGHKHNRCCLYIYSLARLNNTFYSQNVAYLRNITWLHKLYCFYSTTVQYTNSLYWTAYVLDTILSLCLFLPGKLKYFEMKP